jgi:xylulokinase
MCGVTGASPDDVMTAPLLEDTIDPNQSLRAAYEDAYQSFRAGYSKLKDLQ